MSAGGYQSKPKTRERIRTNLQAPRDTESEMDIGVEGVVRRMDDLRSLLSGVIHLTPEQQKQLIEAGASEWEKKQKLWKAIQTIGAVAVFVFSSGMAYQMWIGANATDNEVNSAVYEAVKQHNGGTHPSERRPDGKFVGDHPEMIEAIQSNANAVRRTSEAVEDLQKQLPKMDLRGEYQFEFSRWQAQIIECERTRRCRAPSKPARIEQLETKLMLGDYTK